MKKYNIADLLYPIVIYYLISGFVFFALNILLGESQEIYMVKQMISSGATIPFLTALFKQDTDTERVVYGKQKVNGKEIFKQAGLAVIAAGTCGIALNDFIAMTPLVDMSAGFQTANENFFAGGIFMEILASCAVVPVAEELLFRGIILKRSSAMAGKKMGIVCSALLFGIIHMNLVQFLYAALLGGLLAFIVAETNHVSLAVLGHAVANLIAILRAETGILDFAYELSLVGIIFSLVMLAAGVFAAWKLSVINRKHS